MELPAQSLSAGVGRWLAAIPLTVIVLAAATMFLSRLLPTPLAGLVALPPALVVGLLTAWEARNGGRLSPSPLKPSRNWLYRHAWLRIPALAAICFVSTFVAVQCGALSVVTAISGAPSSQTLTLVGTTAGGSYSCRGFDVAEAPMVLDRALCAPTDMLGLATPGRKLTVYGKASPFGLNVERFEIKAGS